jgi:hypothetical protein
MPKLKIPRQYCLDLRGPFKFCVMILSFLSSAARMARGGEHTDNLLPERHGSLAPALTRPC